MKVKLEPTKGMDRVLEAYKQRLEALEADLPENPTMADLHQIARKHFLDDPTTISILTEQLGLASKKAGKKNMPAL